MTKNSASEDFDIDSADVDSLEEARRITNELRQKMRIQSQQLLAWRRAYKMQESLVNRLQREKAEQLKMISSKLLLFESRLIRKQKDISILLNHRENIIYRQQRVIEGLTNRLIDNGLEPPASVAELVTELECCTNLPDVESLNDSDSAVVLEDADYELGSGGGSCRFRSASSDGVTIMRSISDAIDPNLKYAARRSNGFLRRPEVLETVYSVEEDGDSAENHSGNGKTEANKRRDAFALQKQEKISVYHNNREEAAAAAAAKERNGSVEKQCEEKRREEKESPTNGNGGGGGGGGGSNQVTTYNRVMSNHRSVTKPKDVKYKRINKAKSKSLEELRGRLKNWVEQGGKLTGLTLEHSQSYA